MENQFTASTQRSVPLVARLDVQAHQAEYLGEPCWVIKDPVKLKYYRLTPEQYTIFQLLDGSRNSDEIQASFQQKFPAQRPTASQIQQMVLNLYQQGLVWSQRPGQGNTLSDRRDKQRWQQLKQTVRNVLFIRVPGFDPTRILASGYDLAKWMFHPATVLWAIGIIALSWIFIGTHATEFGDRLPSWDNLFSWKFTLTMWAVLGATKIIHELGHAFACRHFGGECHEIGVAFLIFSPCLYCDVSDSWTLRQKWQRIAIAAAGVYIELIVASLAFFVWWNTQAGWLNQVCLTIFIVSNVSTLLFNLNPLLRLDGYYILSDWLEIPNLRQKSDQALENAILKTGFGVEPPAASTLPPRQRFGFVLYSIASAIYRATLVVVISFIFYSMLKPYRLEMLGLMIGLFSAGLGAASWFNRIRKSLNVPTASQTKSSRRPYIVAAVGIALLAGALLIPIPISVTAPMQIEFENAQHLYAHLPGELLAIHVRPGQIVQQGQCLMELANEEKTQRLQELTIATQVQTIELRKQQALGNAKESAIARETLNSLEAEWRDQFAQLDRLKILAPCDGKIVGPRWQSEISSNPQRLATWSGTPLDGRNLNSLLDTGTHLLSVAPVRQFHGMLMIGQLEIHSFREGQTVRIKLDHLPNQTFQGTIERISAAALNHESTIPTHASRAEPNRSANQSHAYQAVVRIDADERLLLPGVQGFGKVLVNNRTASNWLWRNVRSTFNFQL